MSEEAVSSSAAAFAASNSEPNQLMTCCASTSQDYREFPEHSVPQDYRRPPSEYRELGTYSAEQFAPHSTTIITDEHAQQLPAACAVSSAAPHSAIPRGYKSGISGSAAAAVRAGLSVYEADERRH